jgi:hypothetical protein
MKPTVQRAVALGVSAVLAVLDIAGIAGLGTDGAPPPALILTGAALGVVTLGAALPALRGSRRGAQIVIVSRVLSAVLGIPVFFAADAPGWAPPAVLGSFVLTALAIWLLARSTETRSDLLPAGGAR